MAGEFVIAWDDFTGGYFVGPNHANQPANTWRGTGVYSDPNDGMLNAVSDWSAITYSAGSPTATAGAWDEMWTDGTNIFRFYVVSGNLLNVALYGYTGAATTRAVTNYTTSNVSTLLDTEAWTDAYIFASYTPSSGANNLVRFTTSSGARATYTTTEALRYLARWGEFMVGSGNTTTYRLYYSAAYDPTTWAGDYYDIGDASPITAIIPYGDTLYIAKTDSWWALTGVPGTSASIRRVAGFPGPNGWWAGTGVSVTRPISSAVATPYGVLYTSTQLETTASLMNGGLPVPVNHAAQSITAFDPATTGTWVPYQITPGVYLMTTNNATLTSSTNTVAWWLDATTGGFRWAKINVPSSTSGTYPPTTVARYLPGVVTRGRAYIGTFTGSTTVTLYTAALYPSDDLTSGSVTGVAHLAERRARDESPFVVTQLYVEVCWLASASAGPAITAKVEMRGGADIASPGRYASTSVAYTPTVVSSIPGSALYHDDRFVYQTLRYSPDGITGTSVVPILSFSECKVRRVWAVCKPADRL